MFEKLIAKMFISILRAMMRHSEKGLSYALDIIKWLSENKIDWPLWAVRICRSISSQFEEDMEMLCNLGNEDKPWLEEVDIDADVDEDLQYWSDLQAAKDEADEVRYEYEGRRHLEHPAYVEDTRDLDDPLDQDYDDYDEPTQVWFTEPNGGHYGWE